MQRVCAPKRTSFPPVSHIARKVSPDETPTGEILVVRNAPLERISEPDVLLIEDCEDDEILSLRALRKCGLTCRVKAMHSGDEAMNELAFRRVSGQPFPHLILLDLQLPGRSGSDVLRSLRALPSMSWLPVIVLTGHMEDASGALLADIRPVTVLRKPIDVGAFRLAVHALGVAPLLLAS